MHEMKCEELFPTKMKSPAGRVKTLYGGVKTYKDV
jgi:hypothetical protein